MSKQNKSKFKSGLVFELIYITGCDKGTFSEEDGQSSNTVICGTSVHSYKSKDHYHRLAGKFAYDLH